MIGLRRRRPISESDGNVAIIFALVCLPLLLITGLALDSARQVNSNRHLQYATDMASMAAVRAMEDASLTDQEIQKIGQDYYFAQLSSIYGDVDCAAPTVTLDRDNYKATVAGGCALPTIFGAVISGKETIGVSQSATAEIELTGLELAIVLDISDTMIGDPILKAKEATEHLISEVLNERTEDRVRVSLVPFSVSVNAGIYGNRAMGRSDMDDRYGDGESIVCVLGRNGLNKLTDAAPAPGSRVKENTSTAPTLRCPSVGVMPLSNDHVAALSTVSSLVAGGTGSSGHFALPWAWYTLSPNWSGIFLGDSVPTAYGTDGVNKVVVLLSDGAFNDHFDSSPVSSLNAHNDALEVCEGIRDQGIEIFVVGYNPDPGTSYYSPEQMLKTCASGDEYYFHADDENDFYDAFDQIASKLRATRLTN